MSLTYHSSQQPTGQGKDNTRAIWPICPSIQNFPEVHVVPCHKCIPKHNPSFFTLEGLKNSVLICCENQVKKKPTNQQQQKEIYKHQLLTWAKQILLSVHPLALKTGFFLCNDTEHWQQKRQIANGQAPSSFKQFAQTPCLSCWQTSSRCSMEAAVERETL